VAMFFWAPELVVKLFGDKYAASEPTIRFMSLTSAVFMLNQYYVYVVIALRLERSYTYLLLAATVMQVGADIVLIPRWGIIGAVIGMLVMGVTVPLGRFFLCVRKNSIEGREAPRLVLLVLAAMAIAVSLPVSVVGRTFGGLAALVV